MTTSKTSPIVAAIATLAISAGSLMGASTAAAGGAPIGPQGDYDSLCVGQGQNHSVRLYYASDGSFKILRCGTTSGWGYRYIDAYHGDGFDSLLDASIENTLQYGAANNMGGGEYWWVYAGFIVMINNNGAGDGAPIGIIHARSNAAPLIESLGLKDGANEQQ